MITDRQDGSYSVVSYSEFIFIELLSIIAFAIGAFISGIPFVGFGLVDNSIMIIAVCDKQ